MYVCVFVFFACTEINGIRVVEKECLRTMNLWVEHLLVCMEELLEGWEIAQDIRSCTKVLTPKAYFRLCYHNRCRGQLEA